MLGFLSKKCEKLCSAKAGTTGPRSNEHPCLHKLYKISPHGHKTFFMLSSAEHKILSADKYENAN